VEAPDRILRRGRPAQNGGFFILLMVVVIVSLMAGKPSI
jgi:hypothetical protein